MTGLAARAAGLAAVYLLVLTSLEPGDVATGAVLGLAVAGALRPRRAEGPATDAPVTVRGAARLVAGTAAGVVRASSPAARFCLGDPAAPGLVEIPRDGRSGVEVAVWGVLTGESPDEYPVDVEQERGVMIVHVLDASDPDAVRARHRRAHDRLHGREG
jgi:multisubunit Na+/H+ antiporter MnhE subunit